MFFLALEKFWIIKILPHNKKILPQAKFLIPLYLNAIYETLITDCDTEAKSYIYTHFYTECKKIISNE